MAETRAAATDADRRGEARGLARIIHLTDLVVASLLIAGCAFLWHRANNFDHVPDLFSQNVAPDVFPKLLLGTIILLSLTLPFEHLALGRDRLDGGRKSGVRGRTYLIGVTIAVLLAAMPFLGVIVSLYAVALVMPLLWGERRLVRVLPFAALFPTAVVVVFGLLLKVHLDPGAIGVGLY